MSLHDRFPLFKAVPHEAIIVSLLLAVLSALMRFIWISRKKSARQRELQQWIEKAREERESKTSATLHMEENTEHTDEFLSLSAKELAERFRSNEIDPTEAVAFYAKRCRKYGRSERGLNSITEELYDEAFQRAKDLLTKTKKSALPFFGVPISIKECHSVEGCYSTAGMACRLRARVKTDCLVVHILKEAGAIPLCLGNTIQLMMLTESINNIWGRSRNPWDLTRTPGGSSGGDAALVAAGMVPFAMGSDVAGSIRTPAAWCGITGFKPTPSRVSFQGNMRPKKGDRQGTGSVLPTVMGPLARTVDDCALFMETVCVPEMWEADCNTAPLPFDRKQYQASGKLKIGYFYTDDWFEPCSAAKRALSESIQKMKDAGHECIPFTPPTDGWFNYGLLVKINTAEGRMRSYLEALEGEDPIAAYNDLRLAATLPDWLRWIARKFLDKRRAFLLGCMRQNGISAYELWQDLADQSEMQKKWAEAFRASGLDAVVFPALPLPATPHDVSGKLTAIHSYNFIANLLHWPSGVVSTTQVQPGEDNYEFDRLPEDQRDSFAHLASQVMECSQGLPLAVSVLTPAFQDEMCLRVMKEIEGAACFEAKPMDYLREYKSTM